MVYEKLQKVQYKLKAPKGQYNSFGGYKYRNCEDILEAVKPILNEVKALILLSDAVEMIGNRYYVKATAKFVDIETGDSVDVCALAREEECKKGMDGSQITGASSSYARKYALNGLLDIDDTKDSDTTNKCDLNDLETEFINLGGNIDKLREFLGVKKLTASQLKDAIEKKRAKQNNEIKI